MTNRNKKLFNFSSYQRNPNQNHNKTPTSTRRNDQDKKETGGAKWWPRQSDGNSQHWQKTRTLENSSGSNYWPAPAGHPSALGAVSFSLKHTPERKVAQQVSRVMHKDVLSSSSPEPRTENNPHVHRGWTATTRTRTQRNSVQQAGRVTCCAHHGVDKLTKCSVKNMRCKKLHIIWLIWRLITDKRNCSVQGFSLGGKI